MPAVLKTRHCIHQIEFMGSLREFLLEASLAHASSVRKDFRFSYKPPSPDDRRYQLLIEGPESMMEHGGLFFTYPKEPSWVAKSWRPGPDGLIKIPSRTAWATGVLQKIFDDRVRETTFQLIYGRQMHCKYLTTMAGEVELLKWFLDDQDMERDTAVAASFLHELPYVQDLSMRQMLKLRAELRDSFEMYRTAMRLALKNFERPLTKVQARELFRDVVEPRVLALEKKTKREKSLIERRSVYHSAFAAVIVGLGVAGFLTQQQLLTFVGGAMAVKLLDDLAETRTISKEAPSDEFYFLLRLKEASSAKAKR